MIKVPITAILCIALLAFGIGPLFYHNHYDSAVSQEAIRRLKTQMTVPYNVHPATLQVTESRMAGPTPDHVEGTVRWRTLFGIAIGIPRHTRSQQHYDLDVTKWITIWVVFLLVQAGLTGLVLRRIVRA